MTPGAIVLTLPRIPDKKRRPESAFWRDFERGRPALLGALLSMVSSALVELPTTRLETLPRMADFALWVTAAECALRWEKGAFLAAYNANRAGANTIALESTPVAERLIAFMEQRDVWEGTPTQLHNTLTLQGDDSKGETWSHGWPKSPKGLSGVLTRLAPNLRRIGIAITSYRASDAKGTRMIGIKKEDMGVNASGASDASEQRANPENNSAQGLPFPDASSDASHASDASLTHFLIPSGPDVEPILTHSDASDAPSRLSSFSDAWRCPNREHAGVPLIAQGGGRPPRCSDPYCDLEAVHVAMGA